MPRRITLTFKDGTKHVYDGVPDDVTPREVQERAAREFPQRELVNIDGGRQAAIPGQEDEAGRAAVARAQPGPSVAQRLVGAGEAALTLGTGATGGTVGMVGGTLKGAAEAILSGQFGTPEAARLVEQSASRGAQALTYAPRTEAGQGAVEAIGEGLQQLAPVAGLLPQVQGIQQGAQPAAQAAAIAGRAGAQRAGTAGQRVAQQVRDGVAQLASRGDEARPTPGTMGSVGSAGTDMAVMRTATAENLPVPIKLTRGQASRDFEQLRFEGETRKDPRLGAPLRERADQQNAAILQNFDAWVDATGAQAPDVVAAGRAVTSALVQRAARDKAEVRVAYKAAEKAGEMAAPVPTTPIARLLNESRSAESTAPILTAARKELVRLGGADEMPDGTLTARQLTLGDAEQLRKFVNKVTGIDPTNQKFAADIKTVIDAATDGAGGEAYRKARALRRQYAEVYENRAAVADLLTNRRGMADPKVAVDKVFQRSILQASPEDVKYLKRVLVTAGDGQTEAGRTIRANGQQAWRELQGATLQHIREQATRGVATDQRGNPIISPAGLTNTVKALDKNGRLELVFGKQGAQQMRDIAEISQFVGTVPPGAVNTSNTASVLLAALAESGVSGSMTGIPVPLLTGLRQLTIYAKDRRIQQRVQQALSNEEARQRKRGAATKSLAPTGAPPGATIQ